MSSSGSGGHLDLEPCRNRSQEATGLIGGTLEDPSHGQSFRNPRKGRVADNSLTSRWPDV